MEQTLAEPIQARKRGDGRRGGEALLGLGVSCVQPPTAARLMVGGSAGGSLRRRGGGKGGASRWSAPLTDAAGREVGRREKRPWRPGGHLPQLMVTGGREWRSAPCVGELGVRLDRPWRPGGKLIAQLIALLVRV
jgi:hypothetical protein